MPLPNELSQRFDPITADWTYIRWLGDRKGIERITTTWDKTVIDRTNQMSGWIDVATKPCGGVLRSSAMPTITMRGTPQQRFGSSANFGERRVSQN
jgi:hypothetical protein